MKEKGEPVSVPIAAVAARHSCSRQYVHRLVQEGHLKAIRLPSTKRGGRATVRVLWSSVLEMERGQK